jgi:hypothetical protein
MSAIPLESRWAVVNRQWGLCFRCMMKGTEWHHRRGRSVVDEHTHCPCNGVLLCHTCHAWVHRNPDAAQDDGLIVLRSVTEPALVNLHGFDGWWAIDCAGQSYALERPHK